MKFSASYHQALLVGCPTCQAPAGYFCRTKVGKPTTEPHVNRRRRAQSETLIPAGAPS